MKSKDIIHYFRTKKVLSIDIIKGKEVIGKRNYNNIRDAMKGVLFEKFKGNKVRISKKPI